MQIKFTIKIDKWFSLGNWKYTATTLDHLVLLMKKVLVFLDTLSSIPTALVFEAPPHPNDTYEYPQPR